MPTGPAARVGDVTAHGSPLGPGPGSTNVIIGGKPAWRGISAAQAAQLVQAATQAISNIAQATALDAAAAGTPGAAAAKANLINTAVSAVSGLASLMSGFGSDTHACPIVKVVVPDGTGMVITGSQTVLINGLPACRAGDTIQEATSASAVGMGLPTVIIGG